MLFRSLMKLTKHEMNSAQTRQASLYLHTITSGDTGKAALEGFKDVPGTHIQVFYPTDGVSPMQAEQMQKQEGANVNVTAIHGNFDDAQQFLKRLFVHPLPLFPIPV